jgi:hypothetical protein
MTEFDEEVLQALRRLDRRRAPDQEARSRIEARMWEAHARASDDAATSTREASEHELSVLLDTEPETASRRDPRGGRLGLLVAAVAASVLILVTFAAINAGQQDDVTTSPSPTSPAAQTTFGDEIDQWCRTASSELVSAIAAWPDTGSPGVEGLSAIIGEVDAAVTSVGELAFASEDPEAMFRLNELAALQAATASATQTLGTPDAANEVANLVDALEGELRAAGGGPDCELPDLAP